MPTYNIEEDSIHAQWLASRAKVQIFGGGFGNGKTAALCIKVLQLVQQYPGVTGIVARSTLTALHDTTLKEFEKWCPPHWVISKGNYDRPEWKFTNGSTVLFRYIKQKGKSTGTSTTSSLLSGTYGFIAVDQIDDPEFTDKDFKDILGRLRSSDASYVGTDDTMPRTGPRWFLAALNPVRNWIFHNYIKHLVAYKQKGAIGAKLSETVDVFRTALGDPNLRVEDIFDLVEGPTEANRANLSPDFIAMLRATYDGPMAQRFLDGGWNAYEGLVYPQFDSELHMVSEVDIRSLLKLGRMQGTVSPVEAYDHGQSAPNCYGLSVKVQIGKVPFWIFLDGFKEVCSIEQTVKKIRAIRAEWGFADNRLQVIFADPAIFRKQGQNQKTVGPSVAEMFHDNGHGLLMTRGQNDMEAGIAKIGAYLNSYRDVVSPFTGTQPSPYLFFNRDRMDFVAVEFGDYIYKVTMTGERSDKPRDANDHAMDMVKYCATAYPRITNIIVPKKTRELYPTKWYEDAA